MPGTRSMFAFDLKASPSPRDAKTTISFALPIGVLWADGEQIDGPDRLAYVISPSVFIGVRLAPGVEFVASPKLFIITPDAPDHYEVGTEVELGTSIGLRFHDPTGAWAIHPEIGFLRASSPLPVGPEGETNTFVMLGVGITAGN